MFTTQHYKAIADVINTTKPDGLTGVAYRTKLVDALCEHFKSDNDRFHSGSFMVASGTVADALGDNNDEWNTLTVEIEGSEAVLIGAALRIKMLADELGADITVNNQKGS